MDEQERLTEKVCEAIRKTLNGGLVEYFSYAWREKVCEMLTTESRFSKLMQWLDKEIKSTLSMVNVFCPADKNKVENYEQNGFLDTYKEQMQRLAIMIHCRELLLDTRTTTEMRENIEQTVCELCNTRYSEFINEYM